MRDHGGKVTEPAAKDGEKDGDGRKTTAKSVKMGEGNEGSSSGAFEPRKIISYKDICVGVNGGVSFEDEEKAFETDLGDTDVWESGEEAESDEEGDDDNREELNPMCPVIRLTREERKGGKYLNMASQEFKVSVFE